MKHYLLIALLILNFKAASAQVIKDADSVASERDLREALIYMRDNLGVSHHEFRKGLIITGSGFSLLWLAFTVVISQ